MSELSVLVIDDNALNLKLMKVMLSIEGYDVHTAASAREAREKLSQMRPELVLMDIQLPDTDGLTLTRELRADPTTSDLKIIAVTAYAMKGDDEKAIDAGCDGYIAKPVDGDELTAMMKRVLAG